MTIFNILQKKLLSYIFVDNSVGVYRLYDLLRCITNDNSISVVAL